MDFDAIFKLLEPYSERRKFQKSEILVREGQINQQVICLLSGVLRIFVTDRSGKEHTLTIRSKRDVFYISINSYLLGEPSYIATQALTDCDVLVLEKDKAEKVMKEYPQMAIYQYKRMADYLVEKHKTQISLVCKSAEERYLEFFEERGELFNQIPHHIIASYLRMTPETLSRLRKS